MDTRKKIKYDENRNGGSEYVDYRGKRVYGSWNEMNPSKENKVRTAGLSKHIVKNSDGTFSLNEASWDKVINPE
tara:strand:- start:415 stop:636 length:222 start_codon:yes stop_codon:yes gene_type:complete